MLNFYHTYSSLMVDCWALLKPTIEIIILWAAFYHILVFFSGTRAFQVLKGIIYLLVAFFLSQVLGLHVINWVLTKFFGISIIAVLIIFQQELRHGLARLGQQHLFTTALAESELIALINEITSAVYKLAGKKTGCILAIEKETKLKTYIESGVSIDSKTSSELIQSIFTPSSPLHDGGVIIQGERVAAASCLFPLAENISFSKTLGTRHRAALGMSEQTDAVIIVASEETGEISIATEGRLIRIMNQEQFINLLRDLLTHRASRND